jgi:NAD(P)-dependent dehydrogenase (short-subunit alcohol dehydrogenase family)
MTGMGSVLITGIGGGLGGECSRHLAGLGYDVIGWDASVGDNWQTVDVADGDAVDHAMAGLPPLVGVVHCAGVSNRLSIADLSVNEFARVMRVNAVGTFAVARASYPLLVQGAGAFVAVASVAGSAGFRNRVAYSSSKAAVIMMVKSMAIEWAPAGVRAVCISPGFVDAGMSLQGQQAGATPSDAILAHTPADRLVAVSEFASTVAFALSPAASGITGSEIVVDGGFLALGGF